MDIRLEMLRTLRVIGRTSGSPPLPSFRKDTVIREYDIGGIVGLRFSFLCKHGSHEQLIVGSITGISYSDEMGFMFQISNERFWGLPILGLFFDPQSKTWTLTTSKTDVVDIRNFEGTFSWHRHQF
jgi:hypothetical protein